MSVWFRKMLLNGRTMFYDVLFNVWVLLSLWHHSVVFSVLVYLALWHHMVLFSVLVYLALWHHRVFFSVLVYLALWHHRVLFSVLVYLLLWHHRVVFSVPVSSEKPLILSLTVFLFPFIPRFILLCAVTPRRTNLWAWFHGKCCHLLAEGRTACFLCGTSQKLLSYRPAVLWMQTLNVLAIVL